MPLEALWVEKYRPTDIVNYVFPSKHIENVILEIIETKNLPHLLLTGSPGTGKTTLALMLANTLLENRVDFLMINASDENSVDIFRDKVKNFAGTWAMGNYKIIFLDEFDYASPNFQAALRVLMETESNTCRFIITANNTPKVIPAIRSRCTHIHFPKPDINDVTEKAINILMSENVEISDIDILDDIVRAGYPDLRKVINLLQEYTINGILTAPGSSTTTSSSWESDIISAIKQGDYNSVSTIVTKNVALDEYDSLYTFMGNNVSNPQGIIYVADYMFKAAFVCDAELNFKALCLKLQKLEDGNGK